MILLTSHFRALEWFTPTAMRSRINIFKEAANEVRKIFNICFLTLDSELYFRATLPISASQNTFVIAKIWSKQEESNDFQTREYLTKTSYNRQWHKSPLDTWLPVYNKRTASVHELGDERWGNWYFFATRGENGAIFPWLMSRASKQQSGIS